MTLDIDVRNVKSVLLPDGEWYEVVEKSFQMDDSFFRFSIRTGGSYSRDIHGPCSSVMAVEYRQVEA